MNALWRKAVLCVIVACATNPYVNASPGRDFWDYKKPADWSPDEIDTLRMNSPWARTELMVRRPGGEPAGWRMDGRGDQQELGQYIALVRWDSALPIREAGRIKPNADYADYYVVSITGLPARRFTQMLDSIKGTTKIQLKGKTQLPATRIAITDGALVFFFSRNDRAITLRDKEVLFYSRVGRMELRVKFLLKEMTYLGQLEL
jgi:hypothetical protein